MCVFYFSRVLFLLDIRQAKIQEFLGQAEVRIESLSSSFKALKTEFKSLAEYFSMKKKTTMADFLVTMKTFLGEVKAAQLEFSKEEAAKKERKKSISPGAKSANGRGFFPFSQSKTRKEEELEFAGAVRPSRPSRSSRPEGLSTSCQLPTSSNDDLEQVLIKTMRTSMRASRRRTTREPKGKGGSGNIDGMWRRSRKTEAEIAEEEETNTAGTPAVAAMAAAVAVETATAATAASDEGEKPHEEVSSRQQKRGFRQALRTILLEVRMTI